MNDGWILQFYTIRPDVTFELTNSENILKSLIYVMDAVNIFKTGVTLELHCLIKQDNYLIRDMTTFDPFLSHELTIKYVLKLWF
jgi:hypothetical protein